VTAPTNGASPTAAARAQHHRLGRNIFSNWTGYAVNLLVSFLISPFLVHNLGDVGYGIWAVTLQLCGSFSLLDIGLRTAVTRYLTHHHTRDEREQANVVFASAFMLLGTLAILVASLGVLLATHVHSFIDIPATMNRDARWTVMLIGLTVAITFPGALFGGALVSLSRYDILNLTNITTIVVRALLWWWVVSAGYGIVGVAAVRVISDCVLYGFQFLFAWRLYGGFRLRARREEVGPCLRILFQFSVFSFLLGISQRLILASDKLVAGVLLGVASVTYYAIGISLVEHLRGMLFTVTSVLVPLSTSLDAKGDRKALGDLLVRGSRLNLLLILPVIAGFLILGQPFIALWMGERYAEASGTVLLLLSIPLFFAPMRSTCSQVLYGMNRHKFNAYSQLVEAVTNLGLSIFLAKQIGLYGIAWGTLIPAVAQGFVLPAYTARQLGIGRVSYYWDSLIKPMLATVPFAVFLLLARGLGFVNAWVHFFATLALGMPLYLAAIWHFCVPKSEQESARGKLRTFFQPQAST
jgi:O-antigen/teichoic acid export membrane protein